MGKRGTLFILIFILLLAFRAGADATIGYGAVTLSADTLKPNDTLTVNTSLINFGPGEFIGVVDFAVAINGVQNVDRSIFNSPISNQTIQIAPYDSFAIEFHVVIRQQYLIPGSDIFVVWPILAYGNTAKDSLVINLNVSAGDPAAISEPASEPELKLFYDGQAIVVDYIPQPEPTQLRIFDLSGRVIYTAQMAGSCRIPFDKQTAGIYFVEVTLAGEARKVFKAVKMER